jgi:anti-sigma B factor antagonist
MLNCKKRLQDEISVIEIEGKLNALTAMEMRAHIQELIEEKAKKVVLDLANLSLIDSSGVGALVSLIKRVHAGNGKVVVSGIQGQPKEIFTLLNLHKAFDLAEDQAQAFNILNQG